MATSIAATASSSVAAILSSVIVATTTTRLSPGGANLPGSPPAPTVVATTTSAAAVASATTSSAAAGAGTSTPVNTAGSIAALTKGIPPISMVIGDTCTAQYNLVYACAYDGAHKQAMVVQCSAGRITYVSSCTEVSGTFGAGAQCVYEDYKLNGDAALNLYLPYCIAGPAPTGILTNATVVLPSGDKVVVPLPGGNGGAAGGSSGGGKSGAESSRLGYGMVGLIAFAMFV
ncbi:hypothetical protein BC830DRAFT_1097417 [Chytriomyces sp. MP71]|nr:hypothetical protein BC830DRAFT_1097417 [Chytriomyces sp. MP71]